jgi:hypothetical protein
MNLRILVPLLTLASVAVVTPRPAHADDKADAKKACADAYGQAQTLRDAHKLRAARDQLRACSQASCKGFILQDCTTWLGDVEARIPSVVVVATDATGAALPNVSVSVDGEAALRKVDGTSWDVDPGPHTFTFVLADGTRVDKAVLVLEAQKDQRVTATVASAQAATAPVPVVAQPPVPPPVGAPAAAAPLPSRHAGHGQRVLGLTLGGVGVAGLAVGGIFGGLALSSWNSASSECPSAKSCSGQAINDHNSAGTSASVSNVGFIAGAVLLAGGLTVYFTAPKDRAPAASVGVGPGSVIVGGRF